MWVKGEDLYGIVMEMAVLRHGWTIKKCQCGVINTWCMCMRVTVLSLCISAVCQ